MPVPVSFQQTIIVSPSEIDDLGHVNNVVYVKWAQELASAHWDYAASANLKQKYSWVVLRHEIDYRAPAFVNDIIIGTTSVGAYDGAKFERFIRFTQERNNKLVCEVKTVWCLLDAASMRPLRVNNEVLEVFFE